MMACNACFTHRETKNAGGLKNLLKSVPGGDGFSSLEGAIRLEAEEIGKKKSFWNLWKPKRGMKEKKIVHHGW